MQLYTLGANQQLVDHLVRSGARFIVVGSLAVQCYSPSREVKDLDLLIEPSRETAGKIIAALDSFPLIRHDFTVDQIAQSKRLQIQLKIFFNADLITPGPDMNFDEHWQQARDAKLGRSAVRIASVETLILLLSQSTEPKHVQDIAHLKQIAGDPGDASSMEEHREHQRRARHQEQE